VNRWGRAAGVQDSRERVEAYIQSVLGERAQDPRWGVFLDEINPLLERLEQTTPLRFRLTRYPDAFAERAAGSDARHVQSLPIPLSFAGKWARLIRRPPDLRDRVTNHDLEPLRPIGLVNGRFVRRVIPKVIWRKVSGRVTTGVGLVAALAGAYTRAGGRIYVRARARHLLKEQGRVIGVVVETDGQQQEVRAKHGVVVACGGFDWNADLMRRLLPVPIEETQTPPVNRGDAIQLAEEVGAQLRHLDEAWWLPGKRVPGRPLHEDQEIAMWLTGDRIWPHSLWVNARGQRFCNEAAQNTGNELIKLDAQGAPVNLPCYCIFDAQFRRRYPILGSIKPSAPSPDWLIHAPSLEALAQELSIPANELARTVERFNQLVRGGRDTDFGRGDGAYERFFGDESAGHPTLGTVAEPPFYAYPIRTSSVGTKGGIMTNRHAQALDTNDAPIAGLYAAGNATAAFNGPLTVAAGCTITPALVMGRVAALHALGQRD
jgi:hypothetical protein